MLLLALMVVMVTILKLKRLLPCQTELINYMLTTQVKLIPMAAQRHI